MRCYYVCDISYIRLRYSYIILNRIYSIFADPKFIWKAVIWSFSWVIEFRLQLDDNVIIFKMWHHIPITFSMNRWIDSNCIRMALLSSSCHTKCLRICDEMVRATSALLTGKRTFCPTIFFCLKDVTTGQFRSNICVICAILCDICAILCVHFLANAFEPSESLLGVLDRPGITHWGRCKVDPNSQTILSNASSLTQLFIDFEAKWVCWIVCDWEVNVVFHLHWRIIPFNDTCYS